MAISNNFSFKITPIVAVNGKYSYVHHKMNINGCYAEPQIVKIFGEFKL